MTDLRQQIASQISAYHTLDAVKAAVQEWASASDGSLDALEKALSAHRDDEYELTEDDWPQLKELGSDMEVVESIVLSYRWDESLEQTTDRVCLPSVGRAVASR